MNVLTYQPINLSTYQLTSPISTLPISSMRKAIPCAIQFFVSGVMLFRYQSEKYADYVENYLDKGKEGIYATGFLSYFLFFFSHK
jgi:hypothetical protein